MNGLDFCERLMSETGVLVAPGKQCFGEGRDFEGYVRFGFCCETKVLEEGLEKMGEWMRGGFGQVAVEEG